MSPFRNIVISTPTSPTQWDSQTFRGGSGWYINLVDNTNQHGPEGQSQFRKDHGEAEPCFGTVVEGRDVIDSFREMETEGNSYLKERVKILSTQLL